MNRGQLAAAIHKRMVDDNRFGYSWEERWGANPETWTVDGHTFPMKVGDYDCSSSTITAWKKALIGTKWANSLDGATYTGNMRSVFTASGLFEWKPMSFTAEPGDLYLNEANHVAMCQTQVPDVLSEFCWGDNGAYGNKRGDQSGREAKAGAYYDYPWDGILHYNHKADDGGKPKEGGDLKRVTNSGGNVYRLYNPDSNLHMLTASTTERDALKKAGWKYEGVAFKAPKGGTDAVYRLYDPKTGDHLFTTSFEEAQTVQKAGWAYEGVPFFGVAKGRAVYRLYRHEHLFTADARERDALKKSGWKYEGIAWRA